MTPRLDSEALASRNPLVCEKLTSRVNFSKHSAFSRQKRCNENLDFRDTSRNSVEHFEQRTDRRLIVAASADGVGKKFFEACKIDELGSHRGEVSNRNPPMQPCARG
jgi:hypothetical protein